MEERKPLLSELCDELVPTPDTAKDHQNNFRIYATVIVSSFFLIFVWLTISFSTDTGVTIPGSWQLRQSIDWQTLQGGTLDDGDSLLADEESSGSDVGQYDASEEDVGDAMAIDYKQYRWHRTLHWNAESDGRLIVIGDIHGMVDSLKQLLDNINYVQAKDTLIFAGDLAAKHPSIKASTDTVDYIKSLNAPTVRGNHDDGILMWRHWMEDEYREHFSSDPSNNFDFSTWSALSEDAGKSTRRRYPKSWKWGSQHFHIAKKLSQSSFEWYADLPLTLHIPSLHSFIVHAGMLPMSTRTRSIDVLDGPDAMDDGPAFEGDQVEADLDLDSQLNSLDPAYFTPSKNVRKALEASASKSILLVKQNRDPYTLIEMRGVKKGGKPSKKGNKGVAWHRIWNKAMQRCTKSSRLRRQLDVDDDDQENEVDDDQDDVEETASEGSDLDVDEELDNTKQGRCQRTNIMCVNLFHLISLRISQSCL